MQKLVLKDKVIGLVLNKTLTQFTDKFGVFEEREIVHLPLCESSVVCDHCGKVYDLKKLRKRTPCCNYEVNKDKSYKKLEDLV